MEIHHISITSKNIKKDLKFYQDIFGLQIFKQYKDDEMEIYLLKGNIILEIFWFRKFNDLPKYKKDLEKDIKTIGINHFAFSVSDLEKFKNKLKKKKIEIYKDITEGKILKYIFLKDCSGNLVEVVER